MRSKEVQFETAKRRSCLIPSMLKSKKLEEFNNQRLASAQRITATIFAAKNEARHSFGNCSSMAADLQKIKTTRRLRVLFKPALISCINKHTPMKTCPR